MTPRTQIYAFVDGRVGLSPLNAGHAEQFLENAKASMAFHHPWLQAPTQMSDFEALLERAADPGFIPMVVCTLPRCEFVGMINFSQIIRGAFQNAFLSYWVGVAWQGKGYMTEGMQLALQYAFCVRDLHRLEANIQPGNVGSIALVRRLGFVKEGFSEKYLRVMGEWRDHERWAIHREIWEDDSMEASSRPTWRID